MNSRDEAAGTAADLVGIDIEAEGVIGETDRTSSSSLNPYDKMPSRRRVATEGSRTRTKTVRRQRRQWQGTGPHRGTCSRGPASALLTAIRRQRYQSSTDVSWKAPWPDAASHLTCDFTWCWNGFSGYVGPLGLEGLKIRGRPNMLVTDGIWTDNSGRGRVCPGPKWAGRLDGNQVPKPDRRIVAGGIISGPMRKPFCPRDLIR
ncbi:hypothetical protein B0T26DRAFT_261750 [Lasiosphaeria miniovina]|uniref:Uncharacterized protein n=1 Tax=Lasiosphaeria miniovina TaxID=1954250 RepID=A0AA40E5R8_9PEZI|nr:uncharacterized protein B0T26DRAFT_261750 [Lasiosphaeria miniovina]KAK0723483.1 hypothetical protein B0T26DRAFT_261750 [Lasiosphaeria miniovina]